jgi:hypothetical protein
VAPEPIQDAWSPFERVTVGEDEMLLRTQLH